MFRTLGYQTFKTLPRSRILASCRIHTMQAPFSGPPSYDMIRHRFSLSHPDPQAFVNRKRQQEARERGEFIDVHDIGRDPTDYDVLIRDVKHETLATKIAEELGLEYLSKASEEQAKKVVRVGDGYIYGPSDRTIVPFVASYKGKSRWVFFVVGSGCPWVYFSGQASKSLGLRDDIPGAMVTIGGHSCPAYIAPSSSHFSDINLLGTEFFRLCEVFKAEDYQNRRAKLYFGGKWKVVEETMG